MLLFEFLNDDTNKFDHLEKLKIDSILFFKTIDLKLLKIDCIILISQTVNVISDVHT